MKVLGVPFTSTGIMWAAGTGAGAGALGGGSLVSEETCMKEKLEREIE